MLFLVLQSAPIAHRVVFQCFIRLMNGKIRKKVI
nr:MAG TPA: hypothetical protein [Caudoviricetes sp.]